MEQNNIIVAVLGFLVGLGATSVVALVIQKFRSLRIDMVSQFEQAYLEMTEIKRNMQDSLNAIENRIQRVVDENHSGLEIANRNMEESIRECRQADEDIRRDIDSRFDKHLAKHHKVSE